jgi:hypothetical protein
MPPVPAAAVEPIVRLVPHLLPQAILEGRIQEYDQEAMSRTLDTLDDGGDSSRSALNGTCN